uniref:Prophage minor tail protein Z (GPZ) n=1 Tax=Arsenophonus endosymbiont of Trialeurodes vaporariorum TaxID=235567 RepID=A0A3B0M8B5_9GAMM
MPNLDDLARQLLSLRRQIPFATAQAMTSVVRKIEQAQKFTLQRQLEKLTQFTIKSVGSKGARKDDLRVKVFVRDIAASYLEPFEVGGVHKLKSAALLNPKNVKLNKYSNLPRNKLSQLKSKDNVFIGDIDGINGVWQRQKTKKGKKNKKRLKRSSNGTLRAQQKQPMPKLLIRFGDALPVEPVLAYQDRAQKMAQALLPQEISRAFDEAICTAK